jgi:hypothetical protein
MAKRQKIFVPSLANRRRGSPLLRKGLEGPLEWNSDDKFATSEIGGLPTLAVSLSRHYLSKLKADDCPDNEQSSPAAFAAEQKLRSMEHEVAYYRERAAHAEELVQHLRPLIELARQLLRIYEKATAEPRKHFP